LSSHARRRGPRVAGRGDGSRSVRCRVPPLTAGLRGTVVVLEEKGAGSVGDGGLGVETRVRWHSLRRRGREAAGRRAGRPKAWIEVKMLDA
jgi:hypothetical protein